ncbi:MAG: ABC transporter permease [Nocardioides sp.]|uniref:ABC transporter permease n=1 Tax=Nocardioides sp. TaxID=35761 RepID=UPI003D6A21C9
MSAHELFAGTSTLIRLALRRDRLRLPLWTLGIVGISSASAATVKGTYDTPAKIATYGPTAGESAASRITSGRQVALDTVEGIIANEITFIVTLGITLLVVFTVVRHTRAEEESGAAELVRSGVVGRHAAQLAALVVALAATLVVSGLLAAALVALGLEQTGSLAFAAEVGMLGLLFAGLAAAAAQVTASARGALAIAGGLLGAAYVVRGVGAVGDSALYWVSPFGWAQGVDAFGDERWWLLGVLLAAAVICFGLAVVLTARRDAGAGLMQPRAGASRASASLGTPWGLALRTQRGLVIGWVVGLAALAAIFGSVIPEVPDMLKGNPDMLEAMGMGAGAGDALIDAFLGYINLTLGVIGAVFGVASVSRLRSEEDTGRLEALIATPLTRARWLVGSLVVTVVGVVLVALAMGAGMVLGYVPVAGEVSGSRVSELVLGILAQLPAMLFVAALALLVLAWLPRFAALAWALVAWVVLDAFLGETLELPDGVRSLSPFFHLPVYPAETWTAGPTVVLLAATGLVAALAFVGYRRRDVG